jgi:hypothetical protein
MVMCEATWGLGTPEAVFGTSSLTRIGFCSPEAKALGRAVCAIVHRGDVPESARPATSAGALQADSAVDLLRMSGEVSKSVGLDAAAVQAVASVSAEGGAAVGRVALREEPCGGEACAVLCSPSKAHGASVRAETP